MKPDEVQRLQNFLSDRLYNSALNNVGYKCNAEDVFMDIADNRLKTWLHDFYNEEAHTVLKQPRFILHSDGSIEQIKNYDVLDKIRAEIDRQKDWLWIAGYSMKNVDIALDTIKALVAESVEKG